jgi:putative membrane protein
MKMQVNKVGIALIIAVITIASFSCQKENKKHETIRSNQEFVNKGSSSNRFEMEAAGLAIQKSEHQDIREFAAVMAADHTAAGLEMRSLATTKGWEVPTDLLPEEQQLLDRLKNYDGTLFDKEYARILVLAHEKAVDLFENASKTQGLDQDLRNWLNEKLPTLRDHLQHAKELNQQVNP